MTNTRKISEEKVWMKYYTEEAKKTPIPKMSVYHYLLERSAPHLSLTAINYFGKHISYRSLINNIDKVAEAFTGLGVKAGDMVSFVTVSVPETIEAIYALDKIGATANLIDPRLDTERIRKAIVESGSKVTVVLDVAIPKIRLIYAAVGQKFYIVQSAFRSLPMLKKLGAALSKKPEQLDCKEAITWKEFMMLGWNVKATEAPYDGDHTCVIAYTGGTTGFPKGVMLTDDNLNISAFNEIMVKKNAGVGSKFLGIIPIFTSYGSVYGMHMPLCEGTEFIPVPKFDPNHFGELVMKYKPNVVISTPAFYEMLMNSKEVQGQDLSFLQYLGSGGDTMNLGLEKKFLEFMKERGALYPLVQGYGMSEVAAAASFSINDEYKFGSVGIPALVTDIGIFDPDTEEELGYGELGEICISGPTVMKGYFNAPEETANVLHVHKDGKTWVHSGDIGHIDEDGFLFVKGRIKRMICRFDGHKVFPVTIESLVSAQPGVVNNAVIGVNDRGHGQGQYPLIVVEYDPEITDIDAKNRELFRKVSELCEERGKPVGIVALPRIPLTGAGKNDSVRLGFEYADYDYTAYADKL